MTFVQIEKRNGMINLDGYSRNKTLKGALKDLAREVAKIDEGEGNIITENIDEYVGMIADGMINEPGCYYIEAEEVHCASRYSEKNDEMEYAEGHWYLYIRFCAPEQESEKQETAQAVSAPEATDTPSTLTEEEVKFFNDTVARIKYSVNVRVPIEPMNHEQLTGTNKEALGICWAEDDGTGKPTPFRITIDEFFIHECFVALEKPYMKIEPETLEQVIAHEIAHLHVWRHGKKHTELTERICRLIEKGEPHGLEDSGTASRTGAGEITMAAMQHTTTEQQAKNTAIRYAIYEGNMERLEKKMARIQNKCRKYGCDFRCEEVGEEFRELKDDNGCTYTARFVIIEAEGVAVVSGWRFIASVEHTSKGNIINRACDIEVPERYYTGQPMCEHCNSRRGRKDTYIVMNEETGEFKQVGKSCLKDFTNGMSATVVAQYIAAFDDLIKGEEPCEGCRIERYIETEEWLRYVAETIRHFGYVKYNDDGEMSTRSRASDYYDFNHGESFSPKRTAQIRRELYESGFNADSDEAKAETAAALAWLAEQTESNNYMHNLKTVCALDYIGGKHLGITASLFPTYNRELAREDERRRQEKAAQASEWVGSIGSRIEFKVTEITCITGWETQWGYTKLYKITDEAGNIFTWKTSSWVEDGIKTIKGTVKAHNDYKGTKQTELTRCKCAA